MTIKQATTENGVAAEEIQAAAFNEDDAAAAFLSKWSDEDGEGPSQDPEEDEEGSTDEDDSNEEVTDEAEDGEDSTDDHQEEADESTESDDESEESEEESEDDDQGVKTVLGDDAVVKVKVDGKELDVSVKELTRLYGQEAALTRKQQETAAKRKEAEGTAAKLNASLEKLYNKALERWKPYAEIDMLVASKQLDAEQFAALRKEAQAAFEDFRFISEEADGFVKAQQQQQQEAIQAAAQEAIKVLKADIPNWSPALYDQIRTYAIDAGLDANVVNNMVDPVAIKLINKARLYEESKKIATKKKVAAPKKVLKPTVSSGVKDTQGAAAAKAKQKFAATGSVDDAADLFLSRWAQD